MNSSTLFRGTATETTKPTHRKKTRKVEETLHKSGSGLMFMEFW
jgi:hypothetical protein